MILYCKDQKIEQAYSSKNSLLNYAPSFSNINTFAHQIPASSIVNDSIKFLENEEKDIHQQNTLMLIKRKPEIERQLPEQRSKTPKKVLKKQNQIIQNEELNRDKEKAISTFKEEIKKYYKIILSNNTDLTDEDKVKILQLEIYKIGKINQHQPTYLSELTWNIIKVLSVIENCQLSNNQDLINDYLYSKNILETGGHILETEKHNIFKQNIATALNMIKKTDSSIRSTIKAIFTESELIQKIFSSTDRKNKKKFNKAHYRTNKEEILKKVNQNYFENPEKKQISNRILYYSKQLSKMEDNLEDHLKVTDKAILITKLAVLSKKKKQYNLKKDSDDSDDSDDSNDSNDSNDDKNAEVLLYQFKKNKLIIQLRNLEQDLNIENKMTHLDLDKINKIKTHIYSIINRFKPKDRENIIDIYIPQLKHEYIYQFSANVFSANVFSANLNLKQLRPTKRRYNKSRLANETLNNTNILNKKEKNIALNIQKIIFNFKEEIRAHYPIITLSNNADLIDEDKREILKLQLYCINRHKPKYLNNLTWNIIKVLTVIENCHNQDLINFEHISETEEYNILKKNITKVYIMMQDMCSSIKKIIKIIFIKDLTLIYKIYNNIYKDQLRKKDNEYYAPNSEKCKQKSRNYHHDNKQKQKISQEIFYIKKRLDKINQQENLSDADTQKKEEYIARLNELQKLKNKLQESKNKLTENN